MLYGFCLKGSDCFVPPSSPVVVIDPSNTSPKRFETSNLVGNRAIDTRDEEKRTGRVSYDSHKPQRAEMLADLLKIIRPLLCKYQITSTRSAAAGLLALSFAVTKSAKLPTSLTLKKSQDLGSLRLAGSSRPSSPAKMGFDVLTKLSQASQAAEEFVKKKWDGHKLKEAEKAAQAELEFRKEERNQLLQLIVAKRTGSSADEMPLLVCDPADPSKAVFLITIPIAFGRFKLSQSSYKLLARHVGMSMDSVSHWALAVIDRGFGTCLFYELMSDDLGLNSLMKNQFRFDEVTPEFIASWSSCYYVGETTMTHDQIEQLGIEHMTSHPRYSLLNSNCQDMVETLVKQLCNGKIISQAKLREELSLASPRIALDLMVARFKSRIDSFGDHEDAEKIKDQDVEVQKDVDVIGTLWRRIHR
ncbi:putative PPPDE domain-containing protein [Seiridium unicorne]|uniref:PPPDE domain-containing protein n=1 Tax=Seiridium unicorne TaxID=138068 RepID=A0ABR2UFC8_9PEZI